MKFVYLGRCKDYEKDFFTIPCCLCCTFFDAGTILAVTERGTLMPVEVSVCMEGETHYLLNPCDEMDIVFLEIEDVDPLLIGTYVEVEGSVGGLLCEVIDVSEIRLLDDQPLEDNYPPGVMLALISVNVRATLMEMGTRTGPME